MRRSIAITALCLLSNLAPAAEGAISAGDTAWMLVSAALVLFMTIPGLALFYAGLVRAKNALSVVMQCFAITCVCSILWVAVGYGIAFGASAPGWHAVVGGDDRWFFGGLQAGSTHPLAPSVPEPVFALFQMTFAIITPALLVGAFAERIRFGAALLVCALWMLVVYAPVAHMAWGGSDALFVRWGLLDTAGGTAVETNSGIAALVAALMIGKRSGYPHTPMPPHNMGYCAAGAAMLWVGWFGFNAGGALPVGGGTAMAALNTHLAGCSAGAVWALIEWLRNGKPSLLGLVTGAVAGLVGITPAALFVGVGGALAIGAAAGIASYLAVVQLKKVFSYDDSLDVFGVHGIAGIVGTALTGIFAAKAFGGSGPNGAGQQLLVQLAALGVTVVWSALATAGIVWLVDRLVGLRAGESAERNGLDVSDHGEVAYNLEERQV